MGNTPENGGPVDISPSPDAMNTAPNNITGRSGMWSSTFGRLIATIIEPQACTNQGNHLRREQLAETGIV